MSHTPHFHASAYMRPASRLQYQTSPLGETTIRWLFEDMIGRQCLIIISPKREEAGCELGLVVKSSWKVSDKPPTLQSHAPGGLLRACIM